MTVEELMDWCYDASLVNLKVYDSAVDKIIYEGAGDRVTKGVRNLEIDSWDVPPRRGCMTVNVYTEDQGYTPIRYQLINIVNLVKILT